MPVEILQEDAPISEKSVTPTQTYTSNKQAWEEPRAMFVCRLCKKTFYNANALQNHKNTQHDGHVAYPDQPTTYHDEQSLIECVRFIPDKSIECSSDCIEDGLTSRLHSVTTTYVVVKVDGLEEDLKITAGALVKIPLQLTGPFECTFPTSLRPELQCRQIFFSCCDYSRHYREEHTKRRKAALRCQVCERNLDRVLPGPQTAAQICQRAPASCGLCGRIFSDDGQLEEHNRTVHLKQKPFSCPLCAKRFTQHGGLQQHMRMHAGVRPFGCTFCPKAFTQKAGLDQHLRTHTKVKPFKCVVCGKSFSQSVHLRQHMRTHTNIQPFECALCRRRFKQRGHLNFHLRSHGDGTDNYPRTFQREESVEFLNLANVQPVRDGETLYYAAEIATSRSHFSEGDQRPATQDWYRDRPNTLARDAPAYSRLG